MNFEILPENTLSFLYYNDNNSDNILKEMQGELHYNKDFDDFLSCG